MKRPDFKLDFLLLPLFRLLFWASACLGKLKERLDGFIGRSAARHTTRRNAAREKVVHEFWAELLTRMGVSPESPIGERLIDSCGGSRRCDRYFVDALSLIGFLESSKGHELLAPATRQMLLAAARSQADNLSRHRSNLESRV